MQNKRKSDWFAPIIIAIPVILALHVVFLLWMSSLRNRGVMPEMTEAVRNSTAGWYWVVLLAVYCLVALVIWCELERRALTADLETLQSKHAEEIGKLNEHIARRDKQLKSVVTGLSVMMTRLMTGPKSLQAVKMRDKLSKIYLQVEEPQCLVLESEERTKQWEELFDSMERPASSK